MVFNEATAGRFCCIQEGLSGPHGFRDGGVQFGRDLRQRADHHFQSRIMCWQGRGCVEGERRNQLPQHHNKKRHLAWKESTDAMSWELWLMKQLTAQHGVKEPGQRRERLKGWGSRLEWLRETDTHPEHNWLILERHWEEIWIFPLTIKLLPASFFLSHLEGGLHLSILICLGRKRLQIDRKNKGIWKCHCVQKEGKKLSCFLLSLGSSSEISGRLCLWCWWAEVRDMQQAGPWEANPPLPRREWGHW